MSDVILFPFKGIGLVEFIFLKNGGMLRDWLARIGVAHRPQSPRLRLTEWVSIKRPRTKN